MTETVWITTGATNRSTPYHSEESCQALKRTEGYRAVPLNTLNGTWDECRWCAGEVEQSNPDFSDEVRNPSQPTGSGTRTSSSARSGQPPAGSSRRKLTVRKPTAVSRRCDGRACLLVGGTRTSLSTRSGPRTAGSSRLTLRARAGQPTAVSRRWGLMTDGCKASSPAPARKVETRTGRRGRSCPEVTIRPPIYAGRGETRPVEAHTRPVSHRVATSACKAHGLPQPARRWSA